MEKTPVTKHKETKSVKETKLERKGSKDYKNTEEKERKEDKSVQNEKEIEKKEKKNKKQMKKVLQEDIKNINESIMKEGENTFYTVLPQKIKKLDEFLKTNKLFQLSVNDITKEVCIDQSIMAIHAEDSGKKLKKYYQECIVNYDNWRKTFTALKEQTENKSNNKDSTISASLPLPPVPEKDTNEDEDQKIPVYPKEANIEINHTVNELIEYIKSELKDGFRMLASIKMWIQLQVPKMEDGNNFGVEIQGEVIDAISGVEDMCLNILENMSHYFETRASFVQKITKYPNIRDYHQSISEVDQTEYINMKLSCCDLRNNYCALFDLIMKNLDKLLTPRSSNDIVATMY
ncbi:hypothetical protein WA158_006836 [Blastocystis sp. Blastoise]